MRWSLLEEHQQHQWSCGRVHRFRFHVDQRAAAELVLCVYLVYTCNVRKVTADACPTWPFLKVPIRPLLEGKPFLIYCLPVFVALYLCFCCFCFCVCSFLRVFAVVVCKFFHVGFRSDVLNGVRVHIGVLNDRKCFRLLFCASRSLTLSRSHRKSTEQSAALGNSSCHAHICRSINSAASSDACPL